MDKVNIDLDEQFLKKFFALTERIIPEGQEITLLMLKKQLDEIEGELKLAQDNKPSQTPLRQQNLSDVERPEHSTDDLLELSDTESVGSALIIDDLGVITYQLSVLFKNMRFEVVTSKEIYDAIEKFKKQSFDFVVMDLFIPTEREGFILLDELEKITAANSRNTKIGVMSASAKKEHKQACRAKGAKFYIEKIDDWQKELIYQINRIQKGLSETENTAENEQKPSENA